MALAKIRNQLRLAFDWRTTAHPKLNTELDFHNQGLGWSSFGADTLPVHIADIVGLNRKSTFADLFLTALIWTRKRQAGELTGSAWEHAYLAAES